jgi:large subunit ribosomal protein L1
MEIKKALAELRKGKKRKFVQTLDLVVNLKNFDLRKEALNTFVNIPHGSDKKVAAFLTKKTEVVDTITMAEFDKYKDLKDIKKLAKKYDIFIAVGSMMAGIATKFGRVFGPLGKMPSPQVGILSKEDDGSIKEMLKKVGSFVRVRNKEMSIKLGIGKEDMSDKELEENIGAVVKELENKLPRKNDNIREVLIKFTMSKPVKILEDKYG